MVWRCLLARVSLGRTEIRRSEDGKGQRSTKGVGRVSARSLGLTSNTLGTKRLNERERRKEEGKRPETAKHRYK